jgi:hypothetical protein
VLYAANLCPANKRLALAQTQSSQQQTEPSPKQQIEWIINKIASNGGANSSCPLIAQNIQTVVQATGVYDSPTIDKMLYTAKQMASTDWHRRSHRCPFRLRHHLRSLHAVAKRSH